MNMYFKQDQRRKWWDIQKEEGMEKGKRAGEMERSKMQ